MVHCASHKNKNPNNTYLRLTMMTNNYNNDTLKISNDVLLKIKTTTYALDFDSSNKEKKRYTNLVREVYEEGCLQTRFRNAKKWRDEIRSLYHRNAPTVPQTVASNPLVKFDTSKEWVALDYDVLSAICTCITHNLLGFKDYEQYPDTSLFALAAEGWFPCVYELPFFSVAGLKWLAQTMSSVTWCEPFIPLVDEMTHFVQSSRQWPLEDKALSCGCELPLSVIDMYLVYQKKFSRSVADVVRPVGPHFVSTVDNQESCRCGQKATAKNCAVAKVLKTESLKALGILNGKDLLSDVPIVTNLPSLNPSKKNPFSLSNVISAATFDKYSKKQDSKDADIPWFTIPPKTIHNVHAKSGLPNTYWRALSGVFTSDVVFTQTLDSTFWNEDVMYNDAQVSVNLVKFNAGNIFAKALINIYVFPENHIVDTTFPANYQGQADNLIASISCFCLPDYNTTWTYTPPSGPIQAVNSFHPGTVFVGNARLQRSLLFRKGSKLVMLASPLGSPAGWDVNITLTYNPGDNMTLAQASQRYNNLKREGVEENPGPSTDHDLVKSLVGAVMRMEPKEKVVSALVSKLTKEEQGTLTAVMEYEEQVYHDKSGKGKEYRNNAIRGFKERQEKRAKRNDQKSEAAGVSEKKQNTPERLRPGGDVVHPKVVLKCGPPPVTNYTPAVCALASLQLGWVVPPSNEWKESVLYKWMSGRGLTVVRKEDVDGVSDARLIVLDTPRSCYSDIPWIHFDDLVTFWAPPTDDSFDDVFGVDWAALIRSGDVEPNPGPTRRYWLGGRSINVHDLPKDSYYLKNRGGRIATEDDTEVFVFVRGLGGSDPNVPMIGLDNTKPPDTKPPDNNKKSPASDTSTGKYSFKTKDAGFPEVSELIYEPYKMVEKFGSFEVSDNSFLTNLFSTPVFKQYTDTNVRVQHNLRSSLLGDFELRVDRNAPLDVQVTGRSTIGTDHYRLTGEDFSESAASIEIRTAAANANITATNSIIRAQNSFANGLGYVTMSDAVTKIIASKDYGSMTSVLLKYLLYSFCYVHGNHTPLGPEACDIVAGSYVRKANPFVVDVGDDIFPFHEHPINVTAKFTNVAGYYNYLSGVTQAGGQTVDEIKNTTVVPVPPTLARNPPLLAAWTLLWLAHPYKRTHWDVESAEQGDISNAGWNTNVGHPWATNTAVPGETKQVTYVLTHIDLPNNLLVGDAAGGGGQVVVNSTLTNGAQVNISPALNWVFTAANLGALLPQLEEILNNMTFHRDEVNAALLLFAEHHVSYMPGIPYRAGRTPNGLMAPLKVLNYAPVGGGGGANRMVTATAALLGTKQAVRAHPVMYLNTAGDNDSGKGIWNISMPSPQFTMVRWLGLVTPTKPVSVHLSRNLFNHLRLYADNMTAVSDQLIMRLPCWWELHSNTNNRHYTDPLHFARQYFQIWNQILAPYNKYLSLNPSFFNVVAPPLLTVFNNLLMFNEEGADARLWLAPYARLPYWYLLFRGWGAPLKAVSTHRKVTSETVYDRSTTYTRLPQELGKMKVSNVVEHSEWWSIAKWADTEDRPKFYRTDNPVMFAGYVAHLINEVSMFVYHLRVAGDNTAGPDGNDPMPFYFPPPDVLTEFPAKVALAYSFQPLTIYGKNPLYSHQTTTFVGSNTSQMVPAAYVPESGAFSEFDSI